MFEAGEAPILHPRVSLRVVASDLVEGGIVRKGEERRRRTVETLNLRVVDCVRLDSRRNRAREIGLRSRFPSLPTGLCWSPRPQVHPTLPHIVFPRRPEQASTWSPRTILGCEFPVGVRRKILSDLQLNRV